MEIRQITFIPIQTYSDEVIGLGYLKVLTETKFESLKLPTSIDKYKFKHLLSPANMITAELVKTRKNWILKNILEIKHLYIPKNFADFLLLAEFSKVLQSYYHDDQEVNLLIYIQDLLVGTEVLNNLEIRDFTQLVAKKLGFA